jgi:hypothetical protein
MILVSATADRTAVGLRAEPHFLYAALEGIIEMMNEHRLNSLVMPMLGSAMARYRLPIAICSTFLLYALSLRKILVDMCGKYESRSLLEMPLM